MFLILIALQDLIEAYVGKELMVAVQDVSREHNRFVGNIIEAAKNYAYSRLKVIPASLHARKILNPGRASLQNPGRASLQMPAPHLPP